MGSKVIGRRAVTNGMDGPTTAGMVRTVGQTVGPQVVVGRTMVGAIPAGTIQVGPAVAKAKAGKTIVGEGMTKAKAGTIKEKAKAGMTKVKVKAKTTRVRAKVGTMTASILSQVLSYMLQICRRTSLRMLWSTCSTITGRFRRCTS